MIRCRDIVSPHPYSPPPRLPGWLRSVLRWL